MDTNMDVPLDPAQLRRGTENQLDAAIKAIGATANAPMSATTTFQPA
jgi:hypothetical protein